MTVRDSDDELRAFLQERTKYPSSTAMAYAIGEPETTVRARYTRARQRLGSEFPQLPPDGFRVKGTSTLYDAGGDVKLTWVKTREDERSIQDLVSEIKEALDGYVPTDLSPKTPETTDSDIAILYPLADWHVGLLSWKKETGHNYDLKIAQTVIKAAMGRLIACAPNSSQGVVVGLGDLLHADNFEATTNRSKNVLDVDGRYPKILRASTELVIYTVDLALQKHESVLLRILPGNHDEQSALAVTLALALYFQNNPRVTVDDDAGRFWWWEWGKCLLGATHGDKAKMKDLPLIMAARNPAAWGRTKFRYIHTGHIHQESGIEKNGVTVESHRSPVAPDAWHVGMGYGAGRSVSAITYHKEHGEIIRQKVKIV